MIHFPNAPAYQELISEVVTHLYNDYPELKERYGERGVEKCREDNQHHFHYLETAMSLSNVKVFTDYALWLNNLLVSRGMQTEHIIDNFNIMSKVIQGKLDEETEQTFLSFLKEAIDTLNAEIK